MKKHILFLFVLLGITGSLPAQNLGVTAAVAVHRPLLSDWALNDSLPSAFPSLFAGGRAEVVYLFLNQGGFPTPAYTAIGATVFPGVSDSVTVSLTYQPTGNTIAAQAMARISSSYYSLRVGYDIAPDKFEFVGIHLGFAMGLSRGKVRFTLPEKYDDPKNQISFPEIYIAESGRYDHETRIFRQGDLDLQLVAGVTYELPKLWFVGQVALSFPTMNRFMAIRTGIQASAGIFIPFSSFSANSDGAR